MLRWLPRESLGWRPEEEGRSLILLEEQVGTRSGQAATEGTRWVRAGKEDTRSVVGPEDTRLEEVPEDNPYQTECTEEALG